MASVTSWLAGAGIATIAAAFGLALLLGYFAARLKLPPLIGYLLAGSMIGPGTPGFVADVKIAAELAEIGVMLLMFGVGLHFSIKELLSVRKIALPGAIVQMAVATAMGAGATRPWAVGRERGFDAGNQTSSGGRHGLST